MSKAKVIKQPYLGIEVEDDEMHYLVGLYGEASVVMKITNSVQQYAANVEEYQKFHTAMLNIIKILGEGHIIQKLDILSKGIYNKKNATEYLQQKYDEHFEGRPFNILNTYLVLTRTSSRKKNAPKVGDEEHIEFKTAIMKVQQALGSEFKPKILRSKEIEILYLRTLNMDFVSKAITLDNFAPNNRNIQLGERVIKCISLIDIDRIDLPEQVAPYVESSENEAMRGFPIDTMAFLNNVPSYETILYNQVVKIPDQFKTIQKLQLKQKRHSGIPDPENEICIEDIERLLVDVARENQMLVNVHFNIVVCAKEDALQKSVNYIDNSLFLQGVIPSKNSYNQYELFRSAMVGNAVELKDYDLFLTTSDAALCYFFKEALPVSEPSPKGFSIRFTDRQGVPIRLDPADYSWDIGRIGNRNKFVLGPSGSGKSFFMNSLVEQYLLFNMDCVIVDTGDSYSGICSYLGGKYITYSAEKPITMNPFLIKKEEYNIEKKEFLQSLIGLLWKGVDGQLSQVEEDLISDVIVQYYQTYFNKKEDSWVENATMTELEQYLRNFNVNLNLLFEEAKNSTVKAEKWNNKRYYDILQIKPKATYDEIKSSFRKLAKRYHPDTANDNSQDITEEDAFSKLTEAYEILINPNTREEYDRVTALMKIESAEELRSNSDEGIGAVDALTQFYTDILKEKVNELEEQYQINHLDFNSFYEFSLFLIPLIKERANIHFDVNEYRFVLKKFYKGGEYQTILNEQSNTNLFKERLIIFEIDNIKNNKVLFPIVTLIVLDVFVQKMRFRQHQRKALIVEEAWKAIASPIMAPQIVYLYKTVRKFMGEVIVVTQELTDIISNEVVKDSIINNSDTFCLLDQTKFKDNYDNVAQILSLNEVERRKIFTVNNLDNKSGRGPFKEVYIKRGSTGEVYGVEVSLEQYLTYTTEKPEKLAVETYTKSFGNYPSGLERFVNDMKTSGSVLSSFVSLINAIGEPLRDDGIEILLDLKKHHGTHAPNFLANEFIKSDLSYSEWLKARFDELLKP
ncbi:TraG/VirB4 family ATPase [Sphingobacterium siyangense]|uniref:TraG/VirB4 family ATPase n=1 Tax=Sphingobacterium siyangense TaxID=459529 RepID=UPI00289A3B29|nr:DnaJ domain-containing protein [Sphingobacterium siyangense]